MLWQDFYISIFSMWCEDKIYSFCVILVSTLKACLSQSFFDMLKWFRAFPGQLSPSVCRSFSSIDLGSTVAVVIPFNASTHVYFSLYSSIWRKFSETYCVHRAPFIMSFGSHICDKVSWNERRRLQSAHPCHLCYSDYLSNTIVV